MKCSEKHGYMSEAGALVIAARMAGKNTKTLRAYRCPKCQKWHLTKQPKRAEAA